MESEAVRQLRKLVQQAENTQAVPGGGFSADSLPAVRSLQQFLKEREWQANGTNRSTLFSSPSALPTSTAAASSSSSYRSPAMNTPGMNLTESKREMDALLAKVDALRSNPATNGNILSSFNSPNSSTTTSYQQQQQQVPISNLLSKLQSTAIINNAISSNPEPITHSSIRVSPSSSSNNNNLLNNNNNNNNNNGNDVHEIRDALRMLRNEVRDDIYQLKDDIRQELSRISTRAENAAATAERHAQDAKSSAKDASNIASKIESRIQEMETSIEASRKELRRELDHVLATAKLSVGSGLSGSPATFSVHLPNPPSTTPRTSSLVAPSTTTNAHPTSTTTTSASLSSLKQKSPSRFDTSDIDEIRSRLEARLKTSRAANISSTRSPQPHTTTSASPRPSSAFSVNKSSSDLDTSSASRSERVQEIRRFLAQLSK